ncbi:hypothetical protein TIFTF001_046497 [Ficus carica]|uniref:Uncharacterized protein n=1 Tax=Ficus carica TaxID=3494 RepID=A0AA88D9R5_FICCA|nr:hypothetical protein TIFTF001_046497 [Ficus carica]
MCRSCDIAPVVWPNIVVGHHCITVATLSRSRARDPMIEEIDDAVELVVFSSHDVLCCSLDFFTSACRPITNIFSCHCCN